MIDGPTGILGGMAVVEDRSEHYLRLAQEGLALSRAVLAQPWPTLTPEQLLADPLTPMIHVIWSTQTDRLAALLSLQEEGLAHVGTPFVRLGYDEVVWLAYFAVKVPAARREEVLRTLAAVDVAQRESRQFGFLGADAHARHGFRSETREEIAAQLSDVRQSMERLYDEFEWTPPRSRRKGESPDWLRLPDTYGLAKQLGDQNAATYTFLFQGFSQHVHSSPWRLMRAPTRRDDQRTEPQSDWSRRREANFAIGWVVNNLLNVVILSSGWQPILGQELRSVEPYYQLHAQRIMDDLDEVGLPPLIEAYELEWSESG